MGVATVGQWGQLAATEMRLWGQNLGKNMLFPPLKFGEHAVKDINRKFCPHWRKAVAPPLVWTRINRLPAVFHGGGAFLSHDLRDLSRESRGLAPFDPFGEAGIWLHDSVPNLVCKNLVICYLSGIQFDKFFVFFFIGQAVASPRRGGGKRGNLPPPPPNLRSDTP